MVGLMSPRTSRRRRTLALGALAACMLTVAGAFAVWLQTAAGRGALEGDSVEIFRARVVPVLNRRCTGCHGVPEAQYRSLEKEPEAAALLRWPTDDTGRIGSAEQQLVAYDRCARERHTQGRTLRPIDTELPPASLLARAPLATAYSGYWRHPEVFAAPDDPDYATLVAWLEAEARTHPAAGPPLSRTERFFADKVVPILARKTCFGANCHGELAFNDLKLDAGVPALSERFSAAMHRANRQAMLGKVTRLVHLDGDVEQSRQVLKNVPVEQGGIVHKGGNQFFGKDDPDYRVLVEWLRLEADDARRRTRTALGEGQGLVFVRRPRHSPERFFEDLSFLPGGDLYWLRPGGDVVNLTAGLHPGAAVDVRAPTVSYDARRVAFAMRPTASAPFDLWEIDLDTRAARQLTFSTDPAVHFLDPLYVPDPDDRSAEDPSRDVLVFTSNVAGRRCQSSPAGRLGEADGGSAAVVLDRQLTERPGTYDGRAIRFVRGANAGAVRRIRRHEAGQLRLDAALPRPVDSTTHYAIDVPAREAPCFDAYRMRIAPPGQAERVFRDTVQRMTYSPSQTRRPTLRSSGEIVFTALRTGVQDGRPFFNGALFRTHVDGSNFHTHNGNRSAVPIFADDRELPNGLEVRIGRDADSWWGGALLISDHQFGPTIEPDNPLDNLDRPYANGTPANSTPRFVPGWVPLDRTVAVRGESAGGAYRDPFPMPDGSLVVAWAPGPLDLANADADPNFDIVRLVPAPSWHAADGFAAGGFRREPIVAGPDTELWPRPVVARLKEPVAKVLQRNERLFGAPAVTRGFTGYAAGTPAVLHVADLLLLDAFFEQITPVGARHIAAVNCPVCGEETPEIDQVHGVRLVGWRDDRRVLIAETVLEPDGSFYAAVPSGLAFDIQSLNGRGMALRSPNRWLYAQPGEKHTLSIPRRLFAQTCAGCHGGLTGRPADTLRRPDATTSASRTLATWSTEAESGRMPVNWTGSGPVAVREVGFDRDVRPIVESRCATCHAGPSAAAGLDLSGPGAFDALRGYTSADEALAIKSALVEKLLGRELHAPGVLAGDRPHPSAHPLSESEMSAIVRWIDLGAMR